MALAGRPLSRKTGDPELAKRLRNLRIDQGFSQLDVSKATGLSLANVAQTENGRTKPNVDTIARYIALYGVTFEDLCGHLIERAKDGSLGRRTYSRS